MNNENIEKRILVTTDEISFRAIEEDDPSTGERVRFIEGYAAVFNSRSKLIMEFGELFYEEIEPGAFRDVLESPELDVYLTFNHSRDYIIGRTKSGTLILREDETGLWFKAQMPETQVGHDTWELVKRGDLFENSFAFSVDNEGFRWTETEDDIPLRIITNVRRLVDVSVVTHGAYSDTSVAARQLAEYRDSGDETPTEPENDEIVEPQEIAPIAEDTEKERMKMKIKI